MQEDSEPSFTLQEKIPRQCTWEEIDDIFTILKIVTMNTNYTNYKKKSIFYQICIPFSGWVSNVNSQ